MGLLLPSRPETNRTRSAPVRRCAGVAVALAATTVVGGCGMHRDSAQLNRMPSIHVAEAALMSGAPDVALRVADMILAKQPNDVAALTARGDALYSIGQRGKAKEAYRAAVAIDPTSVGAQIGLGRTTASSDPGAAETMFQAALDQEPDNLIALNNLGVVRDLQGRNAEAQAAYRQALEASPGSSDIQINLGLSLAVSGRKAEAVQVLRPVAAAIPSAGQGLNRQLVAALDMAGDSAWAKQTMRDRPGTTAPAAFAADRTSLAASTPVMPPPVRTASIGVQPNRQVVMAAAPKSGSTPQPISQVSPVVAAAAMLPPFAQAAVTAPAIHDAVVSDTGTTGLARMVSDALAVPAAVSTPALRPALPAGSGQEAASAPVSQPNAIAEPDGGTDAEPSLAPDGAKPQPLARVRSTANHPAATSGTPVPSLSSGFGLTADIVAMATMSWPLPITAPGDGIRITHQTASKTPAPAQIHATSKPATASVPPYAELGIFGSGDDAIGAWAGLKQLNATLLAGYQPTVTLVTTHGDPAWHLRAVGFTGPADADRFCTQMRIASQGCTIGSSP